MRSCPIHRGETGCSAPRDCSVACAGLSLQGRRLVVLASLPLHTHTRLVVDVLGSLAALGLCDSQLLPISPGGPRGAYFWGLKAWGLPTVVGGEAELRNKSMENFSERLLSILGGSMDW